MKTFPFIVINKGNMSRLEHYKNAHQVAGTVVDSDGRRFSNFIIIKNEKTVVNLADVRGGDFMAVYSGIVEKLESA